MKPFTTITNIGPVYFSKSIIEYGGIPLVFTCKNNDQIYLFREEEDDDEGVLYSFIEVDKEDFSYIELDDLFKNNKLFYKKVYFKEVTK